MVVPEDVFAYWQDIATTSAKLSDRFVEGGKRDRERRI